LGHVSHSCIGQQLPAQLNHLPVYHYKPIRSEELFRGKADVGGEFGDATMGRLTHQVLHQ